MEGSVALVESFVALVDSFVTLVDSFVTLVDSFVTLVNGLVVVILGPLGSTLVLVARDCDGVELFLGALKVGVVELELKIRVSDMK